MAPASARRAPALRDQPGRTLPLAEELFLQALKETAAAVRPEALRGVRLREWSRSTLRVEVAPLVLGLFLAEARPVLEGVLRRLTASPVRVLAYPAAAPPGTGDFVPDEPNRLARRLLLEEVEAPPLFDPIYLHGPTGAGKTLLLRLHLERLRAAGRGHEVRYRTGGGLVRRLQALSFRRAWNTLPAELEAPPLLLVDGLEALTGAPATQALLARLLERRRLLGRRTVLAGREPPGRSRFLPALRSRLAQGLTVAVGPPRPEAVRRHVKRRLAGRGVRVEDRVVARAVAAAAGHPLRAETLLIQAYREAREAGRVLDERGLAAVLPPPDPQQEAGAGPWVRAVAGAFGVAPEAVRGRRRLRRLRRPRELAALLLREEGGLTLAEIGRVLGGRSVSTAAQLVDRGRAAVAGDPELAALVEELRREGGGRA